LSCANCATQRWWPLPTAPTSPLCDPTEGSLQASPSATHCNTLQHTATHCNTLQRTATHSNALHHTASHCITLYHTDRRLPAGMTICYTFHHTATHCNTLQHTATHCQKAPCRLPAGVTIQIFRIALHLSTLQHTVTHMQLYAHCKTLHHTASHCITLHHTAIHCRRDDPDLPHCRGVARVGARSTLRPRRHDVWRHGPLDPVRLDASNDCGARDRPGL